MAVLDRDSYLCRVKNILGDRSDDEALQVIEDLTDTYDNIGKDTRNYDDLERKYNEMDSAWRTKYRERFFAPSTNVSEIKEETKEDVIRDGSHQTFDELFEKREG